MFTRSFSRLSSLSARAGRTFWARVLGSFSHTPRTIGLVWKFTPRGLLSVLLLTLVSAVLPVAVAWIGKLIVDAVIYARDVPEGVARELAHERVIRLVALELLVVVAISLVNRMTALTRQIVGARLGIDLNVLILEKALKLALRHFEDAKFYDKLTRARREASSRPLLLISQNLQIVGGVVTLFGYTALLLRFSPWPALALLILALPAFVAEARYSGITFRMLNRRSPEMRRLNYLEYIIGNDEHAKELKLFGLGPMLLERYKTLSEQFYKEDCKLAVRRSSWTFVLSLLGTGSFYGCYIAIALAAATGHLSLGDMTLYIVAFRSSQNAFLSILTALGNMYEGNLYMSNLFEYFAIPTETPVRSALPSAFAEEGFRFEKVGFQYSDTKKWVLRDISLFIPRGENLALVGENGAGKTTFIKLLTRLYRPTEGRILLDGRDLQDYDEVALRTRLGVIFQDFNRYQFVVRENVGFGSIEHMADEARIARAIERGGAREFVAALVSGLDTQLGRRFQEGAELSGGQWQKIALARAFMREEADILVLDEPTAALDAKTEQAIFERFRRLARGRTAIIISHRFPTVRLSDRILVLEEGCIVEQGTHSQLLDLKGRYSRFFKLQAAGYN